MISLVNAATAYATARRAVSPAEGGADLTAAAQGFAKVMEQADTTATAAMTGGAATHELVASIAEAKLALETVVSIRDKVVEAYQEILRMPV